MRERAPLRWPLFEPGDPRRFDTVNTGGPLTNYHWNQLVKGTKPPTERKAPDDSLKAETPATTPPTDPIELILVDMSTIGETKHKYHTINPEEPKPLP